jgi:hypothetical protein
VTTKAKTKCRQPLPAAVRDEYKCNDCGVNVLVTGEFCMVHPDIWEDQLGLGWDDNLCIGCIEARLGRRLKGLCPDFMSFPSYPWMYPTSERLMDRYGFIKNAKGEWVHPANEKQKAKRNAKRRRAYRRSRMIAA